MAKKKSIKVLLITIALIGLSNYLPIEVEAAPKWLIPEGLKTIEVNGYEMASQETGSGTFTF